MIRLECINPEDRANTLIQYDSAYEAYRYIQVHVEYLERNGWAPDRKINYPINSGKLFLKRDDCIYLIKWEIDE